MLAHEPFSMSPAEIGDLDPWYIINVLFYPRNDKGEFLPLPGSDEPDEKRLTEKEAFWIRWGAKGFADWRIAEFWNERKTGRSPG